MQKISHSTNTADVLGEFTEGSSVGAIPATLITAVFLNCIQRELVNVVEGAGLALNPDDNAQLLAAIRAIASGIIAAATTEKAGVVELATAQEGIAGLDQTRAIVPSVLAAVLANFAKLDSPVFTGAPKVPTAALGTNTLQAASTAFVQLTVAALVDSSPAALNTLNELAAALGDDPNFATTVTNALAGKQPLLGFTPIQQGGGANQGTNKLCIGWGQNDPSLKLQVDSTDFGSAWPIGITGRAQGNYVLNGPVALSGTAFDFTGIPTWVKRITLSFRRGSVSAASQLTIRIGSAGAVDASGYEGCVCSLLNGGSIGNSVLSDGFTLTNSIDANSDINGNVVLERMDATTWSMNSTLGRRGITYIHFTGGSKVLAGEISTVRITTVAGTASLTGTVSLTYEG